MPNKKWDIGTRLGKRGFAVLVAAAIGGVSVAAPIEVVYEVREWTQPASQVAKNAADAYWPLVDSILETPPSFVRKLVVVRDGDRIGAAWLPDGPGARIRRADFRTPTVAVNWFEEVHPGVLDGKAIPVGPTPLVGTVGPWDMELVLAGETPARSIPAAHRTPDGWRWRRTVDYVTHQLETDFVGRLDGDGRPTEIQQYSTYDGQFLKAGRVSGWRVIGQNSFATRFVSLRGTIPGKLSGMIEHRLLSAEETDQPRLDLARMAPPGRAQLVDDRFGDEAESVQYMVGPQWKSDVEIRDLLRKGVVVLPDGVPEPGAPEWLRPVLLVGAVIGLPSVAALALGRRRARR